MGMVEVLRGNCGKPPDYQEKVGTRFSWEGEEVKVAKQAGRRRCVACVAKLLRESGAAHDQN